MIKQKDDTPFANPPVGITLSEDSKQIKTYDTHFFDGEKKPTVNDIHISGYNGSDEYEIMEKVLKTYSDYALDSTNNKTN